VTVVIVAGALGNKPGYGGEAWVRLSWVLGLARLGVDVWLMEEIADAARVDRNGGSTSFGESANLAWFRHVTEGFGLEERSALVLADGSATSGPDLRELADVASQTDVLFNVSGNLRVEPLFSAPRRRVYVDLDPGYTQFWHAGGSDGARLEGHDAFLTVGLNIGSRACAIPTRGIPWRPIQPPVVLEEWPFTPADDPARFTTVSSWRGAYGRVEHDGRVYGLKAHEFRRFAELPRLSSGSFEIALDIHSADRADLELLRGNGWRIADPRSVAGDPWAYRRYVQESSAEFSVAQGIYVETLSGWVSDRTACYLASGKPALVQDTGFSRTIPTGEGVLTFRTLDEAVVGAEAIAADHDRHARAARTIAEECFDSDKVLAQMLEDALA
jgi:hypothetical protein